MANAEFLAPHRTVTTPFAGAGAGGRRRVMPVGHALAVGLICFALWTFFDARQLYNSANVSPLGVRRSAAMSILRPIARAEEVLGADRIVNGGNRALGRINYLTPGGVVTPSTTLPSGSKGGHHKTSPKHPQGPPALTSPTVAKKMTILEVGDSIGEDLGFGLGDELGSDPRVHLLQNAVGDTGLSNAGYFNWPAVLAQQLKRYHPQLVVVMLGGNDWQGFALPSGEIAYTGTKLLGAVYTQRIDEMMAEATAAGAHLVWVGLPIMQDREFGAHLAFLNSIYLAQASHYPGAVFVPTWKLFSNKAGQYSEFLPDAHGNLVEVRDSDGVHIDPPGGTDLLGDYVVNRIEGIWHIKL